jgi:hypothetical protein
MTPARTKRQAAGTRVPAVDIHAHYFSEADLQVVEKQGKRFGVTLDCTDAAGPAYSAERRRDC